jgi:ferrous iron transport protein A
MPGARPAQQRATPVHAPENVTLDALRPHDCGIVRGVDAEEALYHRLAALGLRVGKRLRLIRRAPLGGPLHVSLGMTEIMLRPEEARCVRIERETGT